MPETETKAETQTDAEADRFIDKVRVRVRVREPEQERQREPESHRDNLVLKRGASQRDGLALTPQSFLVFTVVGRSGGQFCGVPQISMHTDISVVYVCGESVGMPYLCGKSATGKTVVRRVWQKEWAWKQCVARLDWTT